MASKEINTNMIEVPHHMIEQVREFMSQLDVKDLDIKEEDNHPGDEECEVRQVVNARVSENGDWEFQILFTDKSVHWVSEENCSCEQKIADFLDGKGVKTRYLFSRVSTKEQANGVSTSLNGQEAELRAAVGVTPSTGKLRTKSYNISGSAYKSIPPMLMRVGKAARPGDSIWVWRVDRLSRNVVHYLAWLEELNNRGVEIYAQSEKLHYRTNKLAFIQGILDAQKEAAAIGARVRLAYSRKRARGDERVGGLPYGKRYRRILASDGKTTVRKVVENNPAEMAIIREIKEAHKKEVPRLTAERLNKQRKFKKGKRWNASMVRRCQKKE